MVAVRREVLEEIMNDPEYAEKLKKCKNINELVALLYEWCRNKGKKIVVIDVDGGDRKDEHDKRRNEVLS